MTTIPHTAARVTDFEGGADLTGFVVPRIIEDTTTPRAAVSLLFAGGLALTGLLSGTGTTAPIAESPVRYIGGWTSTARVVGGGAIGALRLPARRAETAAPTSAAAQPAAAAAETAGADRATQAAEVRWLHEASGLTWEQLGRMFGVSRRAVHLWANGGRMNAANAELLGQLVAVVRELPGDADERRSVLLAPGTDGTSIVDQLRARNRSDARDISGTPFRPEELLGARHDNPEPGTAQT
jgi:DNA-binding transcriptional regulator YiaG